MKNPIEEGELYTLLNHCIERLPKLKEGLVCDCMNESPTTLSFESPNFIIMMKLERKKEEILSIPFIDKIREEANKTIAEELKGFGLDKKQTDVSEGQVRHIIDAYNRLKKEAK